MKTIWKYPAIINDTIRFEMQENAEILKVAITKPRYLAIWALVDPGATLEPRYIRVIDTDVSIPDLHSLDYIDTVIDGPFVWHIFEKNRRRQYEE